MWACANAFNLAEWLLAAFSACIVKGIECVVAMLNFSLNGMEMCVRYVPGCTLKNSFD